MCKLGYKKKTRRKTTFFCRRKKKKYKKTQNYHIYYQPKNIPFRICTRQLCSLNDNGIQDAFTDMLCWIVGMSYFLRLFYALSNYFSKNFYGISNFSQKYFDFFFSKPGSYIIIDLNIYLESWTETVGA